MVSHGHGQGYADVNFIIPETIDRLQLYKGPYFAQFADFANAGALNIITKDEFPQHFAYAEGGSFDTQRYVLGASPRLSSATTLLAAQAYYTNGPFADPQHYARYNVFGKLTPGCDTRVEAAVSGTVYQGDWDGSGQIPRRAVQAGFVDLNPVALDPLAQRRPFDRFDAIDSFEGGTTDRENLDLHYTYTPTAQDVWSFQAYASRYKLQLFSNFTFFKDTGLRFHATDGGSVVDTRGVNPDPTINFYLPGDGIEQNDSRVLYGGRANYTRYWLLADLPVQSQVAVETRSDHINLGLHRQVRRQRFFTRNRVNVEERSVSSWTQHQVFLLDWVRFEAGLRGDVFFFDAANRLPVQGDDPNFDPVVIDGNANDSIVSPKANLIVTPLDDTEVYLNFGTGFHSNDARTAILAESTPALAGSLDSPLTRSLGYIGARTRQFERLDVAAALWLLDLDSELVFSGDGGNQEVDAGGSFAASGSTRRWGIDFETRYRFTDWFFFDYDLSYADARVRSTGEAVPLAPTLLMNGGFTAEFAAGFSVALRGRYLGDRPAIEDRSLTARGYFLLDLLGKYRWRNVEASLGFLHLADTDWREAQFADTSCLVGEIGNDPACLAQPGKQGSHDDPADDIHFTPGNPLTVRGGLTIYF